MGAATDMTLPHPKFLPEPEAPDDEWDCFIIDCIEQSEHARKAHEARQDDEALAEGPDAVSHPDGSRGQPVTADPPGGQVKKPPEGEGWRPMSDPPTGRYVELWMPRLGVYGARPEEIPAFPHQPTAWRKPR